MRKLSSFGRPGLDDLTPLWVERQIENLLGLFYIYFFGVTHLLCVAPFYGYISLSLVRI